MSTDIQIPGYNIVERLGLGGMATVYLAEKTANKEKIALKVMSGRLGESDVWAKRFIQEAQVIAELTHPNVVPIYDVGMHNNYFYIAMELLEGGTLKQKMLQAVDISLAIKVIAKVAAGLDYATEKGFVHRDIKPDNIMFRDNDEPVILDFGIVKQIDNSSSEMTQTGMIIGTAAYMSPEQAQGRELDQRSDIYSLGVLFYEMLTGKQPFQADSDVSTLLLHISEPIPRLPQSLAIFQEIIDKALAKDPFHRYTRAREIIDHIQNLEPQIHLLVESQNNTAADATAIIDSKAVTSKNLEEAKPHQTKAKGSNPSKQVTAEEDLNVVLNSARATIRNYSVASSKRKDRRSKNTIIAASVVAATALSFIGYQQLVTVPKERAVAEAKIREAEEKTLKKVNLLLEEAEDARKDMRADELGKVDIVIANYRQVLKLDPENEQAEYQLRSLGERYLALAASAVRRNDISTASTYREYAESLVADSPELVELRKTMKIKREQQLEKEFVGKEISTLLSVARADFENSDTFSDNAYTKIQQVLAISPGNPKALNLLNQVLERLRNQTETALEKNELSRCESNIKLLEKYYPETEVVANLNNKYQQASKKLSTKKQIQSLRRKAGKLLVEERTLSVNSALQEIYLSILRVDKNNKVAIDGLHDTAKFNLKLASQSIDNRQFNLAEKHLHSARKFTPDDPSLTQLSSQLQKIKTEVVQANSILDKAERELEENKGKGSRRQTLASISQDIEHAKRLDAKNPKIQEVLLKLESAYLVELKTAIEAEDYKLSQLYFADSKKVDWPSDRIFRLEQLTEKKAEKKARHIISSGF